MKDTIDKLVDIDNQSRAVINKCEEKEENLDRKIDSLRENNFARRINSFLPQKGRPYWAKILSNDSFGKYINFIAKKWKCGIILL